MIRVTIDLFRPAFHGLREGGAIDWPPSPVRLLGALKSGAHALIDPGLAASAHRALDAITSADPPLIHLPAHRDLGIPDTYTERTWVPDRLSALYEERPDRTLSLDLFGMDSKTRERKPQGAAALSGTILAYDVPVRLSNADLEALRAAAALVPYFGRSNDPAVVSVDPLDSPSNGEKPPLPPQTGTTWYPAPNPRGGTRGWTAATISWLDANYERVFSEDPSRRVLPPLPADAYTRPLQYATIPQVDVGGGPGLVVLSLSHSLEHQRIPWAIGLVRGAVPRHWRILPLTMSGHSHADGRMVGIGIWATPVPLAGTGSSEADHGLEMQDAYAPPADPAVAFTLLGHTIREIEDFAKEASGRRVLSPRALDSEHWVGPARVWRSTTPLRGFPDSRVLSYHLRQEVVHRYGTDAELLDATVRPVEPWQRPWRNSPYTDGFGQWWVTLQLGSEVSGPLILGASQDDGFGVLMPVSGTPQ